MIRGSRATWGLVGLALMGCGSAEPLGAGSLELSWEVAPRGCDEAGVESVEARISGPEGLVERFDCAAGSAQLGGLMPGIYDVELVGLDAFGDPTFGASERTVTVDADADTDLGLLRLTARPSTLQVGWRFADGRVCGANGADTVSVAVFDAHDYEVARTSFGCDEGEGEIPDIVAGAYLIKAVASGDGDVTHEGSVTVKAGRGEVVVSEVVLEPTR